jgi:hypothetical protein
MWATHAAVMACDIFANVAMAGEQKVPGPENRCPKSRRPNNDWAPPDGQTVSMYYYTTLRPAISLFFEPKVEHTTHDHKDGQAILPAQCYPSAI